MINEKGRKTEILAYNPYFIQGLATFHIPYSQVWVVHTLLVVRLSLT